MSATITRPLGPADEALIAAEREIADLRQKEAALIAAGDLGTFGDHGDKMSDRIDDLETLICNIAPNSLTGAVIKLRQLADHIDASTPCYGDEQSVRQILAVIEREIEPAGAAETDAAPREREEAGDTIAERIVHEDEEKHRKRRDAWNNLFAEWLTNRAQYSSDEIDWSKRDEHAHGERMDELARLITTTPAILPWMILRKIEVLEYYLGADGGTGWNDNREITMLAGIKADLLRFEPGDEDRS